MNVAPSLAQHAGLPGTDVNYTLQVFNTGNTTDTFAIALGDNAWATSISTTTVGPLPANANDTILVTVNIPPGVAEGSTDALTVTVKSQGDPTNFKVITLTTEARTIYGVSVTPNLFNQSGQPGTTVTYTLQITNISNITAVFDIAADSTWTTSVTSTVGPLAAGVSTSVEVIVHIPANAAGGATDTATINVTSQGDPTKSKDAALTTEASTVYDVNVMPNTLNQSGQPGTAINYTLYVTNAGNTTDIFGVALTDDIWATSVSPSIVGPLAVNSNTPVIVTVNIPTGAANGSTDAITVTVTSLSDPSTSDDAALTTEAVKAVWKLYLPLLIRDR